MRLRRLLMIAAASAPWLSADRFAAAKEADERWSWARKAARSSDDATRLRAYRQLWELGVRVAVPKREGACHEMAATDDRSCHERLKACLGSSVDFSESTSWLVNLSRAPSSPHAASGELEPTLTVPLRVQAWMPRRGCDYSWGFTGAQAPALLRRCVATGRGPEVCETTIRHLHVMANNGEDPQFVDPDESSQSRAPFWLTPQEQQRSKREQMQCTQSVAREEALNSGPICHLVSVDPCRGVLGVVCNVRMLGNGWYMDGHGVPPNWQADELSFGWSVPEKEELALKNDLLEKSVESEL